MFSIALTGGRTAREIYSFWSNNNNFKNLTNIEFFLTDERCVSVENSLSNAGMIVNTLFNQGIPLGCKLNIPIESENNISLQASRYEKKLPKNIDIIILSVGDDGHVASIFPNSKALKEKEKYFVESDSPIQPKKRVTLTYPAILNAKKVYILCTTKQKIKILETAQSDKFSFEEFPVKKVLHAELIQEIDLKKAAELLLNKIIKEICRN